MIADFGTIYLVTCKTTQKSYLGMCTVPYNWRRSTHLYRAREGNTGAFYEDMRKYDDEDFVWKILVISDDIDYLLYLEKRLIKSLKTKHPDGYNRTEGGYGAPGFSREFSEADRKEISARMMGNTIWEGKTHTKKSRLKMANVRGYAVRCLNNGNVYPSIKQAYLDTNTNDRYVRDCCNGDRIRDPGHASWKFEWANKEEVNVEPKLREEQ